MILRSPVCQDLPFTQETASVLRAGQSAALFSWFPWRQQSQQPCPGAVMLILGNTLLSVAFLRGLLYLIFSFSPVAVSLAPHSFLPLERDNSPAGALSFPFPNPSRWGYPSPASGTPLLEGPRGPSLLLIRVLPRHVPR